MQPELNGSRHRRILPWSRLLRDVENGGEVILERGGHPVARIVPAVETTSPENFHGMFTGQFTIGDDFDADGERLAVLFGAAR
jgi:antitoxin (DNA-binding transcriptional repressor) of toxin-antitoxin stability system